MGVAPADMRAASAPTKQSPAPVVSTTLALKAGMEVAPSAVTTTAPRPPRVATTARAPFARSCWQAAVTSRTALAARSFVPVACDSSISFSTATSTTFIKRSGCAANGARFRMVRAPAARARFRIASVAAIGVSNCATQTSSPRGSWRAISLVKWRLAPEATVIALSPWATWISATPVAGPSISRTPEQSMSLSARKPRRLLAKASLPTAPIIAVGAPRRTAATAWLRPLPPGRNDTVAPSKVSPGTGRRALCTTTSMLRLPQTTTLLIRGCSFHPGRQWQILLAQECRIEKLGLIALPAIGQDGDDLLARTEIAGEPHGAHNVDGRRAAQHQAFMLDQVEQDGQGLLVADLVGHVDRRALEVGGDAAVGDAFGDRVAFGLELALDEPVVERRAHRVGERDLDLGVALLEGARHAAQGAA